VELVSVSLSLGWKQAGVWKREALAIWKEVGVDDEETPSLVHRGPMRAMMTLDASCSLR
jgi:hypothetical protein